ncbi:FAD-dependent monooxygenase [Kribbella sp. NPDC056861]|uniref:FAD-dependent monooxygenase n=1 Tax=Kribbella sp. NPDC056861 TaxID=3154857 RepID=UPI003445764E
MKKILVSGASIAGPAVAYWLHRYGFEVTVVEKAATVRGGGYPIDIRGTAIEVVEQMGLLPRLQEAHVDSRKLSFLDADSGLIAAIRPEAITGGVEGRDLEVRRGDLADVLYATIRDEVEVIFEDSIATLQNGADAVEVVFRSGARRTFDLVIGADGLHSNTRGLVFGPEEQYHRYLGYSFAGFTMPNELGLEHEALMWNVPGRAAVLYAPGKAETLHGFLTFAEEVPPYGAFRNPEAQRELVAARFPENAWQLPQMLAAMRCADDLFFDTVSQIHMPAWSQGRVVLVGDAAAAPSFMSGQGSSIALVTAYLLAGELATHADHAVAFTAYEQAARQFVELNQALAYAGAAAVAPRTSEELALRNKALTVASDEPALDAGTAGRSANSALTLPTYATA